MKKIPILLAVVIVSFLFVLACKKFNATKATPAEFSTTEASTWYSTSNSSRNDYTPRPAELQWHKGRYKKVHDMEIIEVPYASAHGKLRLRKRAGATAGDLKATTEATMQTIVFIKKNGLVRALAKQYVPGQDYLRQQGSNPVQKGGLPPADFVGEVWLSTLSGKIISVSSLQNNRVTKSFRAREVSALELRNRAGRRTSNECESIEVCEYQNYCCYSASGCWGMPPGCTGWVETGNCMIFEFCEPINCDEEPEYCACEIFGECGGGGGEGEPGGDPGNGNPPAPPVTTEVIDSLTSNCLKSVLNTIGNQRLKNHIIKLYTQTYRGNNKTHNVRFRQAPDLMSGQYAVPAYSRVDPNDPDTWVITLNSSFADVGFSRESWTQIILHELIHGFMRKNNLGFDSSANWSQEHQTMVTTWVTHLRDALIDICGMNSTDALALALGGMDNVLRDEMSGFFLADWDEYVQEHYGISLDAASNIEQDYLDGVRGVVCQN